MTLSGDAEWPKVADPMIEAHPRVSGETPGLVLVAITVDRGDS
jgi:hypothetical protein